MKSIDADTFPVTWPAEYVCVGRAARRLGLHPSRVRALIAAGELEGYREGPMWFVDPVSLFRRKQAKVPRGAPFRPENAWAVLILKAWGAPPYMLPHRLSRARRVARRSEWTALVPRLRHRASIERLAADPELLPRLSREPGLLLSGVCAARHYGGSWRGAPRPCGSDELAGGLVTERSTERPGVVEAYLPAGEFLRLERKFLLEPCVDPNVILHLVRGAWPFEAGWRVTPAPVIALDLVDWHMPRLASAGRDLLRQVEKWARLGAFGWRDVPRLESSARSFSGGRPRGRRRGRPGASSRVRCRVGPGGPAGA